MNYFDVSILAVIQGLAELLPVSSSAHVIMTEKLLGLDPAAPDMTLLLVMLHTGTMFAVIVYFWKNWRETYFSSTHAFKKNVFLIILATCVTGVVGLALMKLIKYFFAANADTFEIESLFSNSKIIATGLAAAGLLIIVSSRLKEKDRGELSLLSAAGIGLIQGLCLPFRGFSRSGATISTGLTLGVARKRAEEFSFALAVVLTPAVIIKEGLRAFGGGTAATAAVSSGVIVPSLVGMLLSFIAGLLALRWLSRWLEHDRWHLFGGYCLCAAALIGWLG
ncbi:UDP-diphosphatase [Pantoea rodasii]|uniref:Undecaprenyl-diphosphatase n=1 Tax=Pantoea rodasii TaxID=1076549 RepID=A0A2M9W723_9GAMM|nr:undecaprenyl-diphosphate phosphatase [Pantoea rodasii]ORM65448.1 UDP-diphosphatase [Pantoea rodasii]PJZ03304.1 UDP-diphosphatase [Pantoea rodasii]